LSEQLPANPPLESSNPNLLYTVWTMQDQNTRITQVAAAYDADRAVLIGSNWFVAREIIKPDTSVNVGVFDNTDSLIAYIGTAG